MERHNNITDFQNGTTCLFYHFNKRRLKNLLGLKQFKSLGIIALNKYNTVA